MCLTGDLLAWTQNGYWATQVRVSFLTLLPLVGGVLYKLAAGGPEFGHLTLTRFFALHAGVFAPLLAAVLWLHGRVLRRAERRRNCCRRQAARLVLAQPGSPQRRGLPVRDAGRRAAGRAPRVDQYGQA